MKTRRLLYLSAHQMTAYRWRSGELTIEGTFEASETGHQQFADYLAKNATSVFSILANVSEEGFQIETIPFLRGTDRQTIINRKLGQLFFNATLTASQSLGYEKNKRKNERILLAALTNNTFFAPWLQVVANAGAALSGLYSLPLLATSLLKKLQIVEDHCLLLTAQDQSIRQSYLGKGDLLFSRLTPLQNSSIGGIAQTFSSEALKLQQYLASQRLIGRDQPITAYVLAHSGALKAMQGSCIDTPTIHFHILNVEECAQKTGLKTSPSDTHCEQLFLNLLVTSPPRIQFANDEQRHGHHLGQIRSALHGLGAIALLGCLLFSGKLWFDANTIGQETEILRNEASLARQRYNDIVKTFPPIPTNNETLRQIIDRYVELERKSATPDGLFHEISHAMQTALAADIERIEWKIGGIDSSSQRIAGQVSPIISIPEASEVATIHGTLKLGANASARQMLDAFNLLVDALKTNPRLKVEVLKRPLDIEPGKSLKGGDTTLEDNKPRSFSLQIVRKLES